MLGPRDGPMASLSSMTHGISEILSYRRDLDDGNAGRDHELRQFFPMSDKGENPVAFPADRYRRIINQVSHNVPIVFRRVPGCAMIESVVG